MEDTTPDARERIMNTVVALILEGKDMSKVTSRDIAARAGVNSALINYYYQSKENLLNQAVGLCMSDMAGALLAQDLKDAEPVQRLKSFLRGISAFAVEHRFLSELSIAGEMKSGNDSTVRTILPILREIYGGRKTELELKLLALQIIVPLQVMLLNQAAYRKSLGEDVTDMTNGFRLLDILVDNIINTNNI
jgi:AcrR family transcriptional regulator